MLLDIRLPDMSGFDVCRTLREEGRTLPILMVTARDEEVDKVVGLELGADDYIVKPFSFRELLSRVRAALRRAYGELASAAGAEKVAFGDVRWTCRACAWSAASTACRSRPRSTGSCATS